MPFRDDEYRKRRPTIHVPAADVRKIDDHVGLHPALDGFSKLLEQQRLAIVQSVGYPNPNRSHFESMAIWQTARLDQDKAAPGWLRGRLMFALRRRATLPPCMSMMRCRCRGRSREAGK